MLEQTPEGFWVVSGDTHIGTWVKQNHGIKPTGDAAREAALGVMRKDDVVLDLGCNIGTHAFHYAKAVGHRGKVIGVDANKECVEAAYKNCPVPPCEFHHLALSDHKDVAILYKDPNVGASHVIVAPDVDKSFPNHDLVEMTTLDSRFGDLTRLNVIKMDVEGCEYDVLQGGLVLIMRLRPIMVIEVNQGALQRQGRNRLDLFALIDAMRYTWRVVPFGIPVKSAQYDILCLPKPNLP